MSRFLLIIAGCCWPAFVALAETAAFRGGAGGRIIEVTRLDDDLRKPLPGMFRWAVRQKGPRIVKFRVAGTIVLNDTVEIKQGRLTIDGSDAPVLGVCLRGGSLEFENADDIVIRHLRVRLGGETTLRKNQEQGRERPENSRGLDCLSFRNCRNVLVEHVSASWSCDELLSVVRCQNVLVQWCILSEPLSDARLHPYGDHHAYCLTASASTLSVRHCLFARYIMRGPQFEANDMRRADAYAVRMEAAGNVMAGFERSGSRYTTGIEDHQREAAGKRFEFQFLDNIYLSRKREPTAIEAVTKHGIAPNVRVAAFGNVLRKKSGKETAAGIRVDARQPLDATPATVRGQVAVAPLFKTDWPVGKKTPAEIMAAVLARAGCSLHRDAADERIIRDVRAFKSRPPLHSPGQAGGWPVLDARQAPAVEKRPTKSPLDRRF